MKKTLLIGSIASLALAIPALAMMHGEGHPMMGATPTTRAEVETGVKMHFEKLDANKDGFVTLDETKAAHTAMQAEKRDQHFKTLDTNADGSISRAEFDAAHPAGDEPPMQHGMRKMSHDGGKAGHPPMRMMMVGHMFGKADANADGKVTLAEALTPALARFDAADSNKDGTLSAEERKAAHAERREHRGHRR